MHTKRSEIISNEPKRILVLRYRFIGDTILTVPFLRNLRAAFPQAQIDVLVGPQSGLVLQGCPYINGLIEFDTTRFHKYDQGKDKAKSFFWYAADLRKRNYDTAFVLKRSFSSALLAWLLGAQNRIGYSMPGRDFLLTKTTPWNPNQHEVESLLDVLRCCGIPVLDNHLEAWISQAEVKELNLKFPEHKNGSQHYLVHAAAAHPDKMYPLESWAKIIQIIHDQTKLTPVFTGAKSDHDLYQQLSGLSGIPCLNLSGQLSLRQSMVLYKQMRFSICVDSGPAHMSAAVGTPTLAIFGPTDPVRWRPFGQMHGTIYDDTLPCRPCHYKKTCIDRPCLTQLDPARVAKDALEIYARSLSKNNEHPSISTGSPLITQNAQAK